MSDAAHKQRRMEDFGIQFIDKLADGWAFSVHESFKDQLDILYREYVDKEKSKGLRKLQPKGENGKAPTVTRATWSRGVPPLLRFDAGQVFYDPPATRHMAWGDALKVLKRVVRVVEAKPDDQPGRGGWVEIELRRYQDGSPLGIDMHTMSQAEFEVLLRYGQLPGLAKTDRSGAGHVNFIQLN